MSEGEGDEIHDKIDKMECVNRSWFQIRSN